MKRLALALLVFYQKAMSPYLPSRCRFLPTCSQYSSQAISRHGILKGVWLTARRLARCHPFSHGGYDPVPEA